MREKTLTAPQPVTLPITINGRITAGSNQASAGEDCYRFSARKGQTLLLEVGAQRYGSPLDAVLEIYNSKGQLVPRAILRSLLETSQTLNDRDSSSRGIRILSWNGIHADDYLLVGNELLQVDVLPKGPDEDTFFKSFNGQRLGFLDTTPEAHAVNTPIYKVSIHPPDAPLPENDTLSAANPASARAVASATRNGRSLLPVTPCPNTTSGPVPPRAA